MAHPGRGEFVQIWKKSGNPRKCPIFVFPEAGNEGILWRRLCAYEKAWGAGCSEVLQGTRTEAGFPGSGPVHLFVVGLLSTAHLFFCPRLFGRTLLFLAVKKSLNFKLSAQMPSYRRLHFAKQKRDWIFHTKYGKEKGSVEKICVCEWEEAGLRWILCGWRENGLQWSVNSLVSVHCSGDYHMVVIKRDATCNSSSCKQEELQVRWENSWSFLTVWRERCQAVVKKKTVGWRDRKIWMIFRTGNS